MSKWKTGFEKSPQFLTFSAVHVIEYFCLQFTSFEENCVMNKMHMCFTDVSRVFHNSNHGPACWRAIVSLRLTIVLTKKLYVWRMGCSSELQFFPPQFLCKQFAYFVCTSLFSLSVFVFLLTKINFPVNCSEPTGLPFQTHYCYQREIERKFSRIITFTRTTLNWLFYDKFCHNSWTAFHETGINYLVDVFKWCLNIESLASVYWVAVSKSTNRTSCHFAQDFDLFDLIRISSPKGYH